MKIYSRKLIHARLFLRSKVKKTFEWKNICVKVGEEKKYCVKLYVPLNYQCAEFRDAN